MKEFISAKKWFIIGGVGIVAVIAAVIIIIVNSGKKEEAPINESYRTITVHELEGVTVIKSGETSVNAYQGENLRDGDDASVSADASMTLRMDSDKYIYAESNAHFWIEATGSAGSTKSVINTDNGDTLHHLQNALGSNETYNVSTPASTMAVRGTVFRVYVYDENGIYYVYLEVYQGAVEVELFTTNHDSVGVTRTFNAGECALMRAGDDFSEFLGVNGGEPGEATPIDYYSVPQSVALNLGTIIDSGEELSITKELLFDYVELNPHEFETKVITEATCTEDGESENVCVVCGISEGKQVIPATGHTITTEVTEGAVCTDGVTTREYCEVCGEEISLETVKGDHVYGAWKSAKLASCTENGLEERVCTVCGTKQSRTTEATGHTFGDYHIVVNASCDSNGSEKRVCEKCGLEESRAIAAIGHNYSSTVTKVATCVETGTLVRTCNNCGRTETEVLAVTSHTWDTWKVNREYVDCEDSRHLYRACKVCYKEETKAGTHTWNEWKTNEYSENCESEEHYHRYCNNCGKEEFKAGTHVFSGAESSHEYGTTEGQITCYTYCDECGDVSINSATIDAEGKCSNCGNII